MFDLAKVPFSRYGSYFSLSVNGWGGLGQGLYLHAHYHNSPQVFKLDPVSNGQPVGYRSAASPTLLRLEPDTGGELEFVLDGTETLRVRGRGAALRLEMPAERWTFACQFPGGWVFNYAPSYLQVGLEVLRGSLAVTAPWEQGRGFCWETTYAVATVSPDDDGEFEIALDSFETTWVKPARPAFDACRVEVAQEYAAWTHTLPACEPGYEATRDLALYVNWSAVVAPAGKLTRPTMLMSKMSMCNVYHWDHAFNAMAHCRSHPDLAWDQLLVMYEHQDAHGKPPSSMQRHETRSTIANSPIQGWALRRMWDANPSMFTPARLAEGYDYLSRWTNWLCTHRTWPGDRLTFCHHGFDAWDNSSVFDEGVPVISPDHPAYLVLQMETLAELASALNQPRDAADWQRRRDTLLAALVEDLWRDDQFVGVIRPSGQVVKCQSLITCMPLVLGRRLPATVAARLVDRVRAHLTPYGLATEQLDSPRYVEGGYWRGPIWAPSTMLIVAGLLDLGERELATTIMRAFCELCRVQGFYENFSPRTGEGHFCPAYTWTSSVFLIFQELLAPGAR